MSFRERRPDIHTSRAAWEKSWEDDMDKNFRKGGFARIRHLSEIMPTEVIAHMGDSSVIYTMQQEVDVICRMQQDLAKEAAMRFAEENFEQKWRALSNEERRKFIMEGIYRTMCIPDMEERRKWCPDSTLTHLASENGETYLRTLKALLPADIRAPITEPKQLPHPVVDRVLSLGPGDDKKPGIKVVVRMYRLSRTYCLTTIIWNTFLAFVSCEMSRFRDFETDQPFYGSMVR